VCVYVCVCVCMRVRWGEGGDSGTHSFSSNPMKASLATPSGTKMCSCATSLTRPFVGRVGMHAWWVIR
jgi:hypothetical protein